MSPEKEYRFERMTNEKFGDLKLLYKDAFLSDVPVEFLRQKYDTGFTGVKFTGFIAYDKNNNPAAYYGVFPLFVEYKNETILACQSGDTMTHSAHRGKKLFIKLAEETFRLAEEVGIKFVYGFPNKNSYHGFMKLNWVHNGYMNKYKIIVPSLPLSFIASRTGALKKKYLKIANSELAKLNSGEEYIDNSISRDEFIRVKHDKPFFIYKEYFKKHLISVNGKKVYLKIENTLQVGDIEARTEEEFWQVIKGLKIIAFKIGTPVITFQLSPGTRQNSFMAKKYKPEEVVPICYYDIKSNLDLAKLKFTFADFDTF